MEQENKELKAEVKRLNRELEDAKEALAGAHRIIRQIRDKDSTLPPE